MERPDTNYLTGPELAQVAKLVDTLNETKPPVAPLSFEINRSHAAVYALSHYRLLTLLAKLDRMSA